MTRKWKNLGLIALLSILQCIAPLVHAHVSDDFHSGSIHFHFNGDILDHTGAATTQPELSDVKAGLPTIGMAQGYKNDYILLLTDDQGASHTRLPTSLFNAIPSVLINQTQPISFHLSYFRPPAQAPPVIKPNNGA
ncbi:hypothetical protein [Candidatus Nitrotoga sp. HW29]|uniref:hypothetical protein n=1 Tax=Candidatus Nitrotoga sp. HW29 TaxID=2886963 RepID=UPI001EF2D9F5|nr:hypothetical protein [Candidatus Nitrotoga sp. HW29]